ncbi:C-C chemokine receptor type 8-like [Nerophis ophidion]|uniref:C-C chemokine receptor type 8-like n=1 Tax=Nerophis ophidion TaxID=159077 RepID=UPI002AE0595F|nr:C-C chemokine receptor type 8-like [Nerophis ophidion]XP_061767853.1 C-C chemokine receptor type 8-like [Nerophis ophidion]
MNLSSQMDYSSCFINSPMRPVLMLNHFTNVFLLPLFIFILYAAFGQTSSFTHSDMFTFHMAAIELIGVAASVMQVHAMLAKLPHMIILGSKFFYLTWFGQVFFHALTCVDRYLAVVHPVTYLGLRQSQGVRLRNIIIAGVWLFCILQAIVLKHGMFAIIVDNIILCSALIVVAFCSLSVLYSLIGPGRGSKCRNKINQSKRRAFLTIVVILGVLFLRLICSQTVKLVSIVVYPFNFTHCVLIGIETITGLPSSLVLPLLFLHKTWPVPCCQ